MTAVDAEHRRISELLGAFVLHATEPDEAEAVEGHLDECLRCRREVDELRGVAAAIGNASEPPPDTLWDRIAGRLDERAGRPLPPDPALDRPLLLGGAGEGAQASATAHARSTRRRKARALVGVGVAAACVALAAVFGVEWSTANGRASRLQRALALQGPSGAVDAALTSPGHRLVALRSTTGAQLAEVVVRGNGVGYVVSSRMRALPGDETYQLWAEISDKLISLGLLGAHPGLGDAFSLGSATRTARTLMVTVEPSGGVVTPTVSPVATGTLH